MSYQNQPVKDDTVKKANDCIYLIRQLRNYAIRADQAIFESESGTPDMSAVDKMNKLTRIYETLESYAKQLPTNGAAALESMDRLKSIYQEEQQDLKALELVENLIDTTNWNECNFQFYLFLGEMNRYRPNNRRSTTLISKNLPFSNWGAEDSSKHPHKLFERVFLQVQKELKHNKTGVVASYLEQNSMSSIIEIKFGVFCSQSKNLFICNQKMLLVEEFGQFESLQLIAPHEEWSYTDELGEKRIDLTKESQYLIFRKLTIQGNIQLNHVVTQQHYYTPESMKKLFYDFAKFRQVFDAQCKYCKKHMKDFMPPYIILNATKPTKFEFGHETCK